MSLKQFSTNVDKALAIAEHSRNAVEEITTAIAFLTDLISVWGDWDDPLSQDGRREFEDEWFVNHQSRPMTISMATGSIATIKVTSTLLTNVGYTYYTLNAVNITSSGTEYLQPIASEQVDSVEQVLAMSLEGKDGSSMTIEDIIESLGLNAERFETIMRIADLIVDGNANLITISSALADLDLTSGSEAKALFNAVVSLGANPGVEAYLSLLANEYYRLSSIGATESSFTFDETDYSVRSFVLTAVFDTIASCVEFAGMCMLFAPSVVGKIVGGLMVAGSYIYKGLVNINQQATQSEIRYGNEDFTNEFAVPLFQGSISLSSGDESRYPGLFAAFQQHPEASAFKVIYPGLNIYVWKDDNNIQYEGFLSLSLSNRGNTARYSSYVPIRVSIHEYNEVRRILHVPTMRSWNDFVSSSLDEDVISWSNLYNSQVPLVTGGGKAEYQSIRSSVANDDHALWRVCINLALLSFHAMALFRTMNSVSESEIVKSEIEFIPTFASLDGVTLGDYVMTDIEKAQALLAAFIADTSEDYYQYRDDPIYGSLRSWEGIVNEVIPALRIIFTSVCDPRTGRSLAPILAGGAGDVETGLDCFDPSAGPLTPSDVIVNPRTKGEYAIIPPKYTPYAFWMSIAVTAAVVAGLAFAAYKGWRRLTQRVRMKSAEKQKNIKSMRAKWMNETDPKEKAAAYKQYEAAVRRYNIMAGLFGMSALSFTTGIEGRVMTTGLLADSLSRLESVIAPDSSSPELPEGSSVTNEMLYSILYDVRTHLY